MNTFDVVATAEAIPSKRLACGQVGTIVEQLDDDHFLVEFADLNGVAYAVEPISANALIELHHKPGLEDWGDSEFSQMAMQQAVRGMENDPVPYTQEDLKELWTSSK